MNAVIYPNPANGETVYLHVSLRQTQDVSVKVYSTAYRKILERTFAGLGAGITDLPLAVKDNSGIQLANGVYYIFVQAGNEQVMRKLLVLR